MRAGPGPDLVLEMQTGALESGAVVSTLADRLRPRQPRHRRQLPRSIRRRFPASPWLFAAALHVPVVLAFGLYRGGNRYDLHFERFARAAVRPARAQRRRLDRRSSSASRTGSRTSRVWPLTIGSTSTISGMCPLRRTILAERAAADGRGAPLAAASKSWSARLVRTPPVSTDFVEYRFSHLLKKPLRSSGTLEYRADGVLVTQCRWRRTARTTEVDGDQVRITRDGKPTRTLSLQRAPQLRVLLGSFRALLEGRLTPLQQRFHR